MVDGLKNITYLEYTFSKMPSLVNVKDKDDISLFQNIIKRYVESVKKNEEEDCLYYSNLISLILSQKSFHMTDIEKRKILETIYSAIDRISINKKLAKKNQDKIEWLKELITSIKESGEKHVNVEGIAKKYNIEIAFHPSLLEELDLIKQKFPELLLFETEMCCGYSKYNRKKWVTDAEYYLNEIIGGIKHNLNAFIDWNMLLDFKGGPNHKKNFCKSPIILDKKGKGFVKTPIYYYLKHIGLAGKAKNVATSNYVRDCNPQVIALKNDKLYITVLNKGNDKKKINVRVANTFFNDQIKRHSVVTYVV